VIARLLFPRVAFTFNLHKARAANSLERRTSGDLGGFGQAVPPVPGPLQAEASALPAFGVCPRMGVAGRLREQIGFQTRGWKRVKAGGRKLGRWPAMNVGRAGLIAFRGKTLGGSLPKAV